MTDDTVKRPRLLTMDELGETLNVSRTTVWRLTTNGPIPTVRIGRRRMVEERAVAEFIASHTDSSTPE